MNPNLNSDKARVERVVHNVQCSCAQHSTFKPDITLDYATAFHSMAKLFHGTHLNGCVAVEFKWFSLPILQVHLQNIWHKKKRVVLHRFLRMEREVLINKSVFFLIERCLYTVVKVHWSWVGKFSNWKTRGRKWSPIQELKMKVEHTYLLSCWDDRTDTTLMSVL